MEDMKNKKHLVYDSDLCWCCGNKFPKKNSWADKPKHKSSHHSIPQCLVSVKNIEIPVYRKCHDDIHSEKINVDYNKVIEILKEKIKNQKIHIRTLETKLKLGGKK